MRKALCIQLAAAVLLSTLTLPLGDIPEFYIAGTGGAYGGFVYADLCINEKQDISAAYIEIKYDDNYLNPLNIFKADTLECDTVKTVNKEPGVLGISFFDSGGSFDAEGVLFTVCFTLKSDVEAETLFTVIHNKNTFFTGSYIPTDYTTGGCTVSLSKRTQTVFLPEDSTYKYVPEEEALYGVEPGTSCAELASNTLYPQARFFHRDGSRLANTDIPGTGCIAQVDDAMNVDIIITGDTDGNGIINSTDYLSIRRFFLKTLLLEGSFLKAADVDFSGIVDSTDYVVLRRYLLRTSSLPRR